MLIVVYERRRNRIWEAQCAYRFGRNRALRALFIDHDADNLRVVRRIKFLQHLFRVRHLRNCSRRYERPGINVLEAGANQGLQIIRLDVGGNLHLQSLPGISWTFDEFDGIRHRSPRRHGATWKIRLPFSRCHREPALPHGS